VAVTIQVVGTMCINVVIAIENSVNAPNVAVTTPIIKTAIGIVTIAKEILGHQPAVSNCQKRTGMYRRAGIVFQPADAILKTKT